MIVDDFRSDTVTRPGPGMRAAMAAAEVGDAVYDDDATTKRLEAMAAERLGKEAALFFPTGTQANLAALMAHCGRGEEYLVGQMAHTYRLEGGGAAVLGSIQPQPIAHQADGTLALGDIEAAIKVDDSHFATTRVIALENTHGGQILPMAYMAAVAELAQRHGLGLHLDGARAFNASVALCVDIKDFTADFDTVSICLSKGLGAPVGSVLVGRADLIETARRNRKMLGGGMRQSGILAAAGLYALEHNVARLADDHRRAKRLAEGLAVFDQLTVTQPHTNIIFLNCEAELGERFNTFLAERGIGTTGRYGQQRWVTHLDVDDEAIEGALAEVAAFFR